MSSPANPNNRDFIAINISNNDTSYPPNSKLFCNLCNCNLILLDPQKEEWWCSRCHVSYYPNKGEKVKRANRFDTPGGRTDSHGNIIGDKEILVSMVDDNPKPKKSELPPSFQDMQRHGVRITSYTTTEDR